MRKLAYYIDRILLKIIYSFLYMNRKILFSKSDLSEQRKWVFIISPGRSGSTILRRELIKYGVGIPPESYDFIPRAIRIYVLNFLKPWHQRVSLVLDVFVLSAPQDHWRINIQQVKENLLRTNKPRNLYRIISDIYFTYINDNYECIEYYGDKTPFLSMDLRVLELLFPNANYISIARNRRDTIRSRVKMLGDSHEFACKRYDWFVKEINSFSKKHYRLKEITLENFSRYPSYLLSAVFAEFEWKILVNQQIRLEMGDDHLAHHKGLANELKPIPFEKDVSANNKYFNNLYCKELEYLNSVIK